jgi:hypothetical protein
MRRAIFELALAAATALGQLYVAGTLGARGPFIVGACAVWIAYLAVRARVPGVARAWGVRVDNLRVALAIHVALVVVVGGAMIAWGTWRGRHMAAGSLLALLALYPIWGFVQQLVVCGIVYRDLVALTRRRAIAIAIVCALFALVHAPNWILCALTGVACAGWLALYERWPNLFAQGLSHGVLATIAYGFVLGEDPWRELLRSMGS